MYARKELLLLDDVFNGLDNKTASSVFRNLLGVRGLLREIGTTVVLATQAVSFLQHSDLAVMLEDGSLKGQPFKPQAVDQSTLKTLKSDLPEKSDTTGTSENTVQDVVKKPKVAQAEQKAVKPDSERQTGDFRLYKFYLKSVGAPLCIGFLILAVLGVATYKLPQVWLRIWTEHGTNADRDFYAGIYSLLAISAVVASAVSMGFYLLLVIPKSAQHLHLVLLKAVVSAPLYFFTTTDSGTLLNRFSQDMTLVDQKLPIAFFGTTFNVLNVLAESALIASGATYVAAIIPFCVASIWALQRYYLRTSRQVRHLDLEAKSPLYTHFTETMSGLTTIRAFGWKRPFTQINNRLLDESQKPYYLLYCVQRWLNVVLDLFVAGIALVLVSIAVGYRHTTSQGAIGLAMVNIIAFNASLTMLINSWTDLETSLGAISRLISFLEETPNENGKDEEQYPTSGWPTKGEIEFLDVTARYRYVAISLLEDLLQYMTN